MKFQIDQLSNYKDTLRSEWDAMAASKPMQLLVLPGDPGMLERCPGGMGDFPDYEIQLGSCSGGPSTRESGGSTRRL